MDDLALVQLLRQLDPDARQELRQLLIREQSGRDAAAERLLRRRTPGADALTELIDPSPLTMRLDAGSPAVLVNSACQRFCAQLSRVVPSAAKAAGEVPPARTGRKGRHVPGALEQVEATYNLGD